MLWFKKDPAERTTVKEYWKATDTVSRPMAIALTLLIGFICLAVTFSLIMGGRWLYHNLSNSDNNTGQTSTETSDGITDVGESGSSTSGETEANSGQNTSSATKSPAPTPTIKKPTTTNNTNNSGLPSSGPSELPNSGPVSE